MKAKVFRTFGQWVVVPLDGARGGIPVSSRKAGLDFCQERGWQPIDADGRPIACSAPT